jgi:hypothetical protein
MASRHAIVQCELTRFTVAESVLPRELQGQITFILDLKKENIEELLRTGKTETVNFMGQKKQVTIEYCDCDNMASHKQK